MKLPCEECISLAMCVSHELIICDEIWRMLEDSHSASQQDTIWRDICEKLPNMVRVRWENNPYKIKNLYQPEPHVYRRTQ